MSPLEAALDWCKRGYHPIPIPFRKKGPNLRQWEILRIDATSAQRYFNGAKLNIGVLLGDECGSADVDLDCGEAISVASTLLPETRLIFGRRSKRRSHYFYRCDPPVPSVTYSDPIDKAFIVELRCRKKDGSIGFQTVVPGSVHESGEEIGFEHGFDQHPANVDATVLQRAVAMVAAAALLARHWPAAGHGRHTCELALAGVLARNGWTSEDTLRFVMATYTAVSSHDNSKVDRVEAAVRDTFAKVRNNAPATGLPTVLEHVGKEIADKVAEWLDLRESLDLLSPLFNDHGNACRLIAMCGNDLRYCHAVKKWLVWDARRWAIDYTDQSRKLAKQTMLEFLRQALDKQNEAAEKFARSSLESRRISSLLQMAECEIYITPAELNTDPFLLNFLNGTIDLRTSELRPHSREDFITKVVHHQYRRGAPCPQWEAFLNEVMGGGPDARDEAKDSAQRLIKYLQRAFGYSLTGSTTEKAVFVLFGEGDNGKSTMLSTYRQLIHEYSVLLQVDTLMVRQESNNTQADLADLRGARFVQTSETEEGQRLAQGKLKRITQGMGKIKATRKYENPIEFTETHKLWMDVNHKPIIRDVDDKATFNRLHPIPFAVRIPRERIDKQLPAKLLSEAEGILAWAVDGARLWFQYGLERPTEVETARESWHTDMDQIGRFMKERCVTGDGFRGQAAALYQEYKHWCESAGERQILPQKHFGEKLLIRGFQKKDTNQFVVYIGIGIRTERTNQKPEL